MFESVLIANRGEIARRVIRTLARLGIRSIAVYSDADRDAPFVREADDALRIGPAAPADSYLSIERILAAAADSGAEAIHPGYGFLSERAAFAQACADAGIAFVGPPPAAMALMGDKLTAKRAAAEAGVPVVPSYDDPAAAPAGDYPLLVKAAAGGGGRGMRVVERPADLEAALATARREALAGFGDERVFVERFLPRARHIEVQVIADRHGTVLHLGERECSLQRRHQKVVEEAPSPVVDTALRARLGEEAVALAQAARYEGAGTVEFIADADDPADHFFLEMNARLQVEHPVTELVTGLDLVELQLRAAAGEPLGLTQEDVRLRGHAIEVRVNAEDPARDFLPSAGTVLAYRRPAGARVDGAVEAGTVVGTDYDSMIAKLIVHAGDRAGALARLDRALADTAILGVTTNVGFLRRLLATDEVRAGRLDTGLLGRLALPPGGPAPHEVAAAAALIEAALAAERAGDDPFARADGWRLGGTRAWFWRTFAVDGGDPLEVRVRAGDGAYEVGVCPAGDATSADVAGRAGRASPDAAGPDDGASAAATGPEPARRARDATSTLSVGGPPLHAEVRRRDADRFAVTIGGVRRVWTFAADGGVLWLAATGESHRVTRPSHEEAQESGAHGSLRAPMPGQVLLVPVAVGDPVTVGAPVVIVESMKMELTIAAPFDGVVSELSVAPGDQVRVDQPVALVEPAAAEVHRA